MRDPPGHQCGSCSELLACRLQEEPGSVEDSGGKAEVLGDNSVSEIVI